MKLTGTVVVVNRLAHYNGFGANSKLGRSCKGLLQIRNREDGRQVLVLSTRKDSRDFDVRNIQLLRTQFVVDGKGTIEITEPPMNIMLRECNPEILKDFMNELTKLRGEKKLTSADSSRGRGNGLPRNEDKSERQERPVSLQKGGPVKRPRSPESSKAESAKTENKSERQEKSGSLRKDGPVKRQRSSELSKAESAKNEDKSKVQEKPGSLRKSSPIKPSRSSELSRIESAKIKKYFRTNEEVMTVRKRENYPNEIPSTIEKIIVQGIGLRRLDQKYLKLKCLCSLDLTENRITEINELTKLNCNLQRLVLAKNLIADIPDDLFNAPPFKNLFHVDLSENKLTKMSASVLNLEALINLNISCNKIRYLPYNWMDLKNLRNLNIRKNRLLFMPATIQNLGLSNLDMSENPELQSSDNMAADYVGYSSVPTLFEMACEVAMNVQRKNRTKLTESLPLPSIVQSYFQGGKYCFQCNKLALRYKIVKDSVFPRSFCTGPMSSCVVCPALAPCVVKKIICHACDTRSLKRRVSRGIHM